MNYENSGFVVHMDLVRIFHEVCVSKIFLCGYDVTLFFVVVCCAVFCCRTSGDKNFLWTLN